VVIYHIGEVQVSTGMEANQSGGGDIQDMENFGPMPFVPMEVVEPQVF
jgi:hypothetical protein